MTPLTVTTKSPILTHTKKALAALLMLPLLLACVDETEFPDTPEGNRQALWQIIDRHYCFLSLKHEQYGLDWNEVNERYRRQVNSDMSRQQLFEVLSNMLAELRDGHVNLSASHDFARYWAWQEAYPANVSDSLLRRYLGTDYRIAAGLRYRILDDNVGYIRYESFTNGIGEGNLNEVIQYLMLCRGLIIDIRGNGGGDLTNAEIFAARFCQERTLVGYYQHKQGPGHDDFSALEPRYLEPSSHLRWHKPVVLLVNRQVFSAANEFAMYMRQMPGVVLVGDRTGGGAGMPFNSSLPSGWVVRFSAVPMYDANGQSTEAGIEPDYHVNLTDEDYVRGRDTLIEFARQLMK